MANVGAGALIFGQALSPRGFEVKTTIFGIVVVLGLYAVGYFLMRED